MRKQPILAVMVAIVLASVVSAQHAMTASAPASARSDAKPLPGSRPGTERWIVHFKERDFHLADLRTAILAHRPADEVAAIVKGLERKTTDCHAKFVTRLEALGGRLLAQWWIIDACAIEIAAADLDAVRALPNVARLEPDAAGEGGIGASTNHLNHNADLVQSRGYRGAGTAVAILDTGADAAMGSSGRPHRTYFPDGDPTKLTGGGIGGSRLVASKKCGTLASAPEDVNGHGTQMAAIAAGGSWGTVGADHGHAYGASIASYDIADNANSSASQASMITGWQTVAADRAAYGITVANNSYQGVAFGDAMNGVELALDSAAYNADLLVTVIAGNVGNGSMGQSGANALVLAAVAADTHEVASWSGHGPLALDPTRFWPDLAAVGVNVITPLIDCEAGNGSATGTSSAAPQVAGAAAILRAAVPALRADETKAILLASALDISAKNQSPPHASRNAYGMGLLRDDTALDTALASPRRWGSSQVTSATTTASFPFAVVAGKQYAAAIAWHRKTFTNTAWSNLDLRVLDPISTVVASSLTPRNLYEMVRFQAAQSGTYRLEVTGVTLDGGAQAFAYAVADALAPVPIAASYSTFGAGCGGSGGNGALGPVCFAANPNATALEGQMVGGGFELAFLETTGPAPATLQGYSLLTASRSPGGASMAVALYAYGPSGLPAGAPLATATLALGSATAWYGATFPAPVTIPASTSFFVAWTVPISGVLAPDPAGTNPDTRTVYGHGACSSSWALGGTTEVAHRLHCAGAGGPAVAPLLMADGLPNPGSNLTVRLRHARATAPVALLTGVSSTTWGALPLPLDLTPFGATGCAELVSGEVVVCLNADAGGTAAFTFQIPKLSALLGAHVYQQCAVIDPVNLLGVVTSNGGDARIGLVP